MSNPVAYLWRHPRRTGFITLNLIVLAAFLGWGTFTAQMSQEGLGGLPNVMLGYTGMALLVILWIVAWLAWTWLNPHQPVRKTPRQPFADLLDHPTPKPANQAAMATALATFEQRTQHTPRPWHTADRTYIEHLVRHAGYHPTPWEETRLHPQAPAADIPTE